MGRKPPGKSRRHEPMKLLCRLVTNPLKPTSCAHPINLCNSWGSGLSDLHHCVGCGGGPWLESVINFPFLPVALSWRPSLFPLRDSDIGHNIPSCLPGCSCFLVSIQTLPHPNEGSDFAVYTMSYSFPPSVTLCPLGPSFHFLLSTYHQLT